MESSRGGRRARELGCGTIRGAGLMVGRRGRPKPEAEAMAAVGPGGRAAGAAAGGAAAARAYSSAWRASAVVVEASPSKKRVIASYGVLERVDS